MNPDERLDALLTALRQAEWGQRRGHGYLPGGNGHLSGTGEPLEAAGDGELAPLLQSAGRLASLRAAQPNPTFAHALQARMLARADARRGQRRATRGAAPNAWRAESDLRRRLRDVGSSVLRPALVAAALLLALGVATLTAAASIAGPGNPLFGLHRLEQSVQAATAGDSAGQARQHLAFARQWLTALRDAAARRLGDPAYSDALAALRDEDAAAADAIAQMPASPDRSALESDLTALRTDERGALQAALPSIGWGDRVTTTSALGALGLAVPRVASATMTAGEDLWHVTLVGAGFEPGAVLLVDGQPAGRVTATSSGLLTAELAREDRTQAPATLGVGNPDGTAAVTGNITRSAGPSDTGTPGEREGTPGSSGTQSTATPGNVSGQGTPAPTATGGDNSPSGSKSSNSDR
jgi:hypothetical protein